MKITCTVQIGNSDDKLSQVEWKNYVNYVHEAILVWGGEIHFSAPSVGWADWQNAAWVFEVTQNGYRGVKQDLVRIRKKFRQDSLAFTTGKTEFV